ncbi:MAG: hydrolase Nlp/P60 [Flavobacteriales bacterium]|nr:hydrolase Nlp/P60 [Flavobacteriales bacterium]
MKYGICHLSVVPCRAEASEKSEQVTQLLFGELIKVYEKKSTWFRIKHQNDGYECYIDEKQFITISQREFEAIRDAKPNVLHDLADVVSNKENGERMSILIGSQLSGYQSNAQSLKFANLEFELASKYEEKLAVLDKSRLKDNALLLLNSPYQWGGRSPFGIDCSGFVQLVYKLNGIQLPRDASQQAKMGQTLSFIEESEEGDLAFFDNEEGNITHVGILLDGNRIIHASGKVRIDKLDHQGIFNQEKNDYTHRLRLITKII